MHGGAKMKHLKTSNLRRRIVIGVVVLVIVVWLTIGLAPVMSEAYSVNVTGPVQTRQAYTETVTVPVEVSQPYTVDVTGQIPTQQPLTYQVTNTHESHDFGLDGCAAHAYVTVKNTDTEAGNFTVNYTFWTTETVAHDTQSIYVLPGEWQTAEGIWQSLGCFATWDWSYTVQPQTKTMITYSTHEETRYRTVTEYQTRQQTQYRTVTEYRTHTETRYRKVSLMRHWMS